MWDAIDDAIDAPSRTPVERLLAPGRRQRADGAAARRHAVAAPVLARRDRRRDRAGGRGRRRALAAARRDGCSCSSRRCCRWPASRPPTGRSWTRRTSLVSPRRSARCGCCCCAASPWCRCRRCSRCVAALALPGLDWTAAAGCCRRSGSRSQALGAGHPRRARRGAARSSASPGSSSCVAAWRASGDPLTAFGARGQIAVPARRPRRALPLVLRAARQRSTSEGRG